MPTDFAFVSWDTSGKLAPAKRNQIRSHCMKGKNKRHDSRRSIRQARQIAKEEAKKTQTESVQSSLPSVLDIVSLNASNNGYTPCTWDADSIDYDSMFVLRWMSPPEPPVNPFLVKVANGMSKTTQEVMHQVMSFDLVTNATYPIESCVDFGHNQGVMSQLLLLDEAFFHVIFLTNSAVRDISQHCSLSKTSRFHLYKAVSLLNMKLSDGVSSLSDVIVYIILCLAVVARSFGEYAALETHMSGLQRLVRLRGGLDTLFDKSMLRFKLDSLDLMYCLTFGQPPRLCDAPLTWDQIFTPNTEINQITPAALTEPADPRLIAAFQDLQHLSSLINSHYAANTRISSVIFEPAISSIQARLIHLKDSVSGGMLECICLGMLAFLSTMFRIPGKKRSEHYYLAQRLRHSLSSMPTIITKDYKHVRTWLLMISAISVFNPEEEWLRTTWRDVVEFDTSWEEIRERLQRVMWINAIHEELGKGVHTAFLDLDWIGGAQNH